MTIVHSLIFRTKQAALLNHMHDENLHLAEIKDSPELIETFGQIKLYHNKLVNIKKDMRTLHEKSAKLKVGNHKN